MHGMVYGCGGSCVAGDTMTGWVGCQIVEDELDCKGRREWRKWKY